MALLSDGIKQKEFDVRMIQRKLSKGLILQEEVEKNQRKLPDDTENADYVALDSFFEGLAGKSGLRD